MTLLAAGFEHSQAGRTSSSVFARPLCSAAYVFARHTVQLFVFTDERDRIGRAAGCGVKLGFIAAEEWKKLGLILQAGFYIPDCLTDPVKIFLDRASFNRCASNVTITT